LFHGQISRTGAANQNNKEKSDMDSFKWFLVCLVLNAFLTLREFDGIYPYYPNGPNLEPALDHLDLAVGIGAGALGMWLLVMAIRFIVKKIARKRTKA
jgi:hypothetical protein